jgi:hypothetical protein
VFTDNATDDAISIDQAIDIAKLIEPNMPATKEGKLLAELSGGDEITLDKFVTVVIKLAIGGNGAGSLHIQELDMAQRIPTTDAEVSRHQTRPRAISACSPASASKLKASVKIKKVARK